MWPWAPLSLIFLLRSGDGIVYTEALTVNAEVLPLGKPLLLFAKSECSALFRVHTPGWIPEPSVGLVVGEGLGKMQTSVPSRTH